jgi:hypothetical protein
MTDRDLMQALRDCYAADARRNIVDSALVRSATLIRDHEAPGANIPGVPHRFIAHITITAPGNDEAANAQLQAQIENRLAGLEAISRSEVKLLPPLFSIL